MEQLQSIRTDLFKKFLAAETLTDTLDKYDQFMNLLKLEPSTFDNFYFRLMNQVNQDSRVRLFYRELNKKINNEIYFSYRKIRGYLRGQSCLIVGGGPCGLRLAIELQLLGARVLIVEKRDAELVNNDFVHIWPFVVKDLKMLACEYLNPKIDLKSIDHIQVKKLELLLLKVTLTLGCEYANNIEFVSICPLSLKRFRHEKKEIILTGNIKQIKTAINEENKNLENTSLTPDQLGNDIQDLKKEIKSSSQKIEKKSSSNESSDKDSNEGSESVSLDRPVVASITKVEYKVTNVKGVTGREVSPPPGDCCCATHLDSQLAQGAFAHYKINRKDTYFTEKILKFSFNMLIDCAGKNTILGSSFTVKKSEKRLEIVITCNFVNKNTRRARLATLQTSIDRNSHPHLFDILRHITGLDLTSLCLFVGETFYLIMIPKKQSLLDKGVLREDKKSMIDLFHESNVNRTELLHYALSAGIFLTGLDDLEFATNSIGETDCKVFNFTSSSSSENACCIKEIVLRSKCCKFSDEVKKGTIFIGLCGDALIDSFWPIGSTPSRGLLSSLDTAWACRQFGMNRFHLFGCKENENDLLNIIAEREAIYELLPGTTTKSLYQKFTDYTIHPATRYPEYRSLGFERKKFKNLLNPLLLMRDGNVL